MTKAILVGFGPLAFTAGLAGTEINLTGLIEAELPSIYFSYHFAGNEILNNGHTVRWTDARPVLQ